MVAEGWTFEIKGDADSVRTWAPTVGVQSEIRRPRHRLKNPAKRKIRIGFWWGDWEAEALSWWIRSIEIKMEVLGMGRQSSASESDAMAVWKTAASTQRLLTTWERVVQACSRQNVVRSCDEWQELVVRYRWRRESIPLTSTCWHGHVGLHSILQILWWVRSVGDMRFPYKISLFWVFFIFWFYFFSNHNF